jgi:hypothetical protein
MPDFEDEIKAALAHAGAYVLQALQAAERGWTSLTADDPVVTDGVEQAKDHAAVAGVPDTHFDAITPAQVVQATKDAGAAQTIALPAAASDDGDDYGQTETPPAPPPPNQPPEDQA